MVRLSGRMKIFQYCLMMLQCHWGAKVKGRMLRCWSREQARSFQTGHFLGRRLWKAPLRADIWMLTKAGWTSLNCFASFHSTAHISANLLISVFFQYVSISLFYFFDWNFRIKKFFINFYGKKVPEVCKFDLISVITWPSNRRPPSVNWYRRKHLP